MWLVPLGSSTFSVRKTLVDSRKSAFFLQGHDEANTPYHYNIYLI